MCCDKLATTHYFFKKICMAEKNKVADKCHHRVEHNSTGTFYATFIEVFIFCHVFLCHLLHLCIKLPETGLIECWSSRKHRIVIIIITSTPGSETCLCCPSTELVSVWPDRVNTRPPTVETYTSSPLVDKCEAP